MAANKLLTAMALCVMGMSAQADVLAKGHYVFFEQGVELGQEYQLSFNYDVGSCNTLNPSGSCCLLLVNNSSNKPNLLFYQQAISSRSQANPLDFIVADNSAVMSMAIYAVDECYFSAPQLTKLNAEDAMDWGQGIGQRNEPAYPLAVTRSEEPTPRYFLRDISRRANTRDLAGNIHSGKMTASADISTRHYSGINQQLDTIFSELTPLLQPQWIIPELGSMVDAHYHTGLVYDYLLQHLNLNSFNNAGASMMVEVDVPFPSQPLTLCGRVYPTNSLFNAFWDGYVVNFTPRILATETYAMSWSAALDVVAHEWGHAVTESGANLNYQREAGALNEAYSDWVGTAVKFANNQTDWVMGSVLQSLRDLANPKRFQQADTYKGEGWVDTSTQACPVPDLCNDYCGVHSNSGVPNKMFYLLVMGGTHNSVVVQGLGMETAIKIATDAVRFYWSSDDNLLAARLGMELAAQAYGDNAVKQVSAAWRAVNVLTAAEQPPVTVPVAPAASSGGRKGGGGTDFRWLAITLAVALILHKRCPIFTFKQ